MKALALSAIALVASFVPGPAALSGQQIRGQVLLPGGAPAKGALVRAIDGTGTQRALGVADRDGRFTLPESRGAVGLRVESVGRRAIDVAIPAAGQDAQIELSLERVELQLTRPMTEPCQVQPSESGLAGQLWAEARKALAVETWARAQNTFGYDVFQYERQLREGDRIDTERARRLPDLTTHPARSRSPQEIQAEGYAQRTPRGDLLYAPSGDVLLSDDFSAAHCFRVQADGASGRIGLAFEPMITQRVDIRGVMWMDPHTAELRSIEFTYTGLTDEATRQPGGGLEFRQLPDGLWLVSRWWVRTPLPRDAGPGHREEGAEVVRVAYTDGSAVDVIGRANLLGLVRDTLLAPVEGARLRLLGTNYEAVTNADGRFLMPDLPPGRFRLALATPDQPDLVSTAQDVWLSRNQSTDIDVSMAKPRGSDTDRQPDFTSLDSIRWVLRSAGLRTTGRVDSLIQNSLVVQDEEPGRLLGRVFDRSTGRGLQGVEVALLGTGHSSITGQDGRFSMGEMRAGQYVIQSRMLGFEARTDTVDVPPGLVIDAEVALSTRAIELAPITVTVRSRWLDSNGFFERRTGGLAGTFYTRREIEQKKPALFTDLLRDVPGVMMQSDEVGKMAVRFRRVTTIFGAQAQEEGSRGCTPGVYYDGVPMNTGFDRLHNIPIPFIDGVEVYVGAATPIQYKNPCGVILIWTRRPR